MQEQKNIRLFISLLILLAVTIAVYVLSHDDHESIVDKTIFRVDDLKSVDEVVLTSAKGVVKLKYVGGRWSVNDIYDADRNLVDVLFATLQQAEPKRPVASSLRDSLADVLVKEGINVSLNAEGKMVKSFFAGGNAQKSQAYFKNDEDVPYIMVIPGYRVYASGIFELDVNGWRDKRVFNFNWRNFKSLSASFPDEKNQDFTVALIDQYFKIEKMPQTDTARLNNYLDEISYLTANQFIATGYSAKYDSTVKTSPAFVIEIKDIADRSYKLTIFQPIKNDPYVLGQIGEVDLALFERQRILPLAKGRTYFGGKQ